MQRTALCQHTRKSGRRLSRNDEALFIRSSGGLRGVAWTFRSGAGMSGVSELRVDDLVSEARGTISSPLS